MGGMYYAYYAGSWVFWGMYKVSDWWTTLYKEGSQFCEKQADKEKINKIKKS